MNFYPSIDECDNIGVELVDCLKVAIQFDSQAQSGHMHFKYNGDIIIAKKLITDIDQQVENILENFGENDEISIITGSIENWKIRCDGFLEQVASYRRDIEHIDINNMDYNVTARQIHQIIENISSLKKIELKSIKLR